MDTAARQQPVLATVLLVPAEGVPSRRRRTWTRGFGAGTDHVQAPEDPAGRPAHRLGELVQHDHVDLWHRCDDELRDPHACLDRRRPLAVGVETITRLSPASQVDEARCVDEEIPCSRCEPGSRNHEPGVSLGDGDGNAGGHDTSLARAELDPFAGDEVEAGIAWVRASRNGRIVAQER